MFKAKTNKESWGIKPPFWVRCLVKIIGMITQDGRDPDQSISHHQVRFLLSRSANENIGGVWMGLDNKASLRQISPYFRKKEKILNPPLIDKEKQEFEKRATRLLKDSGINNVEFVWVPNG